jgi:hypothetical protein
MNLRSIQRTHPNVFATPQIEPVHALAVDPQLAALIVADDRVGLSKRDEFPMPLLYRRVRRAPKAHVATRIRSESDHKALERLGAFSVLT